MSEAQLAQATTPASPTQAPALFPFQARPFDQEETTQESTGIPSHQFGQLTVQPPPPVQAKLTIGQPGDPYEQEADRVAAQVVEQINTPQIAQRQNLEEEKEEDLQMQPQLQRQGLEEEKLEEIQMQPQLQRQDTAGGIASDEVEASIETARGQGQPLDDNVRGSMEQAFGFDFSSVRVHTDGQAHQLNQSIQARAFTTGQDIFFRQGEYQSGSRSGQELLAHELTHVIQQGGSQELGSSQINQKTSFQENSESESSLSLKSFEFPIMERPQPEVARKIESGTLQRDDNWSPEWFALPTSGDPDMQEQNWQHVEARLVTEDPPEYDVQVQSHLPAAPQQETAPSFDDYNCPSHHRSPEPRFEFDSSFERQMAWDAWMTTIGELGQTWNAMRPHVQQYNLATEENREVLDEVYDIRVPDSGTMSTAANQQPAGSAGGEDGRRPESPLSVAEVFSGDTVGLGSGGERGLQRASGAVTTQRRAAEAADSEVERAVNGVQSAARDIATSQLDIEIALNAISRTGAEREVRQAEDNLRDIESERDAAKAGIDNLKTLVIGVAKLQGDSPVEGAAEIAGVIGHAIVDAGYSSRLSVAKARVDQAVARVDRLVDQGDQLNLQRAQSDLNAKYEAFESARADLRGTLIRRREAYDQLAWVAGRRSRMGASTQQRIRAAIAAIPIVEMMVSTLGNGLEAMRMPSYTRQSGIGYGIAKYHGLPHVAQFETHLGQLYTYQLQFMFEKLSWDARLNSLRNVMRSLRGNRDLE